jgi:hypothetical protein
MRGACNCRWCLESRKGGSTSDDIVRVALESVVAELRQCFPHVCFAVNASAPGLNQDNWTGGHLRNLAGIFDEYVTEWNPYRWGQNAVAVAKSLSEAKHIATGRFSHASTLTTRSRKLLTRKQLRDLFVAILSQDASPWLSVYFNTAALDTISTAYVTAEDKLEANRMAGD